MNTKQEILKLALAAGIPKPTIIIRRWGGKACWILEAENRHVQGDWDGNPKREIVSSYGSLEHARNELPGDAQKFNDKLKRDALEDW
jgi:hypothetical protein